MLLLGFFLLPMVLPTGSGYTIDNYTVTIENHVLKNVEPIGESLELDLSGLDLKDIDPLAFRNAANLTSLNLANNLLKTFPPKGLSLLVNLKNLSVANNRIYSMSSDFVGLDSLESVDLSNNQPVFLKGLKNYGHGRCDFILHGSPVYSINNLSYRDRLPTPAQLVHVVMFMNHKCGLSDPNLPDADVTNENVTSADEKIKCPRLVDGVFNFIDSTTLLETRRLKLCFEGETLQGLSLRTLYKPLPTNCKKHSIYGHVLRLKSMGMKNFALNWYNLESIKIDAIDLSKNEIVSLSSNLLNGLPETVKTVRLSENKIERIDAGSIQNQFLMSLKLNMNRLSEIAINAFAQTNLSYLNLGQNSLSDMRFVETLPSSIMELYLFKNNISHVPANSFSKLDNLFILDLRENKVAVLGGQSLRGLKSLQRLDLSYNYLVNIEAGAFQDLEELRDLDLKRNNLTELGNSLFSNLKELIFLDLEHNKFKIVTKDTFKGLPNNLRSLKLGNNEIESLEEGTFVNIPKYSLELQRNAISKLEKGAINIPSLTKLYLHDNKLSEIKEENFDLPNLQILVLEKNLIKNIEKGAFRKLPNLVDLELSKNPITTLKKGSLAGIELFYATIYLPRYMELIEGGVYLDE